MESKSGMQVCHIAPMINIHGITSYYVWYLKEQMKVRIIALVFATNSSLMETWNMLLNILPKHLIIVAIHLAIHPHLQDSIEQSIYIPKLFTIFIVFLTSSIFIWSIFIQGIYFVNAIISRRYIPLAYIMFSVLY